MYKTVRHGENSLQYTILPQTEEVLNNSGLKGKGRDYSPSIHVRRSRRKSTVKYVLLIVFGIVVALALAAVPIYVMNGAMYVRGKPHDGREIITNSPLTPTGREIVKSRKKELKITPEIISTIQSNSRLGMGISASSSTSTSTSTSTTTTALPVVTEKATTPPWTMPALRSWKSTTASTTSKPVPTFDEQKIPLVASSSINLLDHYSAKGWGDLIIRPTTVPQPVTIRNVFRLYSVSYTPTEKIGTVSPKILDDVLVTFKTTARPTTEQPRTTERSKLKDLKEAILSVDDDDDFKESLEVDEVFSLPPLKPLGSDDEVTVSKPSDWYAARWPFVDTSSYFQWSSYTSGDNLLLPLLVAALSSMALVLLLTIAVRRRKRNLSSGAQLSPEAQVDDNTNLLMAENPDDAEGDE